MASLKDLVTGRIRPSAVMRSLDDPFFLIHRKIVSMERVIANFQQKEWRTVYNYEVVYDGLELDILIISHSLRPTANVDVPSNMVNLKVACFMSTAKNWLSLTCKTCAKNLLNLPDCCEYH